MRVHLEDPERRTGISAYGSDFIVFANARYTRSIIIDTLGNAIEWDAPDIAELAPSQLRVAVRHGADILLLGTGHTQRFPPRQVLTTFIGEGIGLEVMDTAAACRTFNVLAAEDRSVAAALMLPRE